MDLQALELIYRNSETKEEMDIALGMHGVVYEELLDMAMSRGWVSSPSTIKNLASCIEIESSSSEDEKKEADADHIEKSSKAAIRRLHQICEHAVTRFQVEMASVENRMSLPAMIDNLSNLVKIREKLTKLEYPMYGLSTIEPQVPVNPISVFLTDPSSQGDGGQE